MKRKIIPKRFKTLAVILQIWTGVRMFGDFQSFLAKFGRKHPDVNQLPLKPDKIYCFFFLFFFFLPIIDSLNGLPKMKFVEFTVFEIMGVGSAHGKFVSGAKVMAAVPSMSQPKEFTRIDLKLAEPGRSFQQTLKYRDLSRNGESHLFLVQLIILFSADSRNCGPGERVKQGQFGLGWFCISI